MELKETMEMAIKRTKKVEKETKMDVSKMELKFY